MKTKTRLVVIALLVLALCLGIFAACAKSGDETPSGSTQPSGEVGQGGSQSSGEVPLKEIVGVTFPDLTVTYDANPHTLKVEGNIPQGVSVKYQNASKTDAGEYDATATLTGQGYKTLVLKAKLVIEKADLQGIAFPSVKATYDGSPHYVEVAGILPAGCSVKYSCKEDSSIQNNATEAGKYTIQATITHRNYNTLVLETTLEITASEKERHMVYAGGKLYFANALDGDKLYSYSAQEGIVKISSDVPRDFAVTSNGEIYYRSFNVVVPSIKKIVDGETQIVELKSAEYVCADNANVYYAVNSVLAKTKGIYKITINNATETVSDPVLLSEGKAEYLQVYGNYLYFADGNNGDKLSRISINGSARTTVVDQKISALTAENGYLFYTVDNLLGDYIASFNINSSTVRKLTVDAGNNLTLIGNQLYYLNVDKLTSYVNGKGIYKVDAYPSSNNNSSGTKVVGADNVSYSSLTKIDSNTIGYYKIDSKVMLCLYNLNSGSVNEVLNGFTAPESTPITTGSKVATYGNYVYYMDLYNDKALYSYNTLTNAASRITAGKVIDFSIIGDTLYFNTESKLVKNYLYKLDLKKNGTPELISENDCVDIVSDGKNIFYVKKNASNVRTSVNKIDSQGNDTEMYSKGAEFLTYYNGYIYFVDSRDLLKMPVEGFTYDKPITVKEGGISKGSVDKFVIVDGVIYFREQYSVGYANKRLSRMNVDGSNYAVIVSKGTDPLNIIVKGDTIYYYNDVTSGSSSGIYSISVNARENSDPQLILARDNTYFAEEMALLNGKIYFVNYYNYFGDSHFYSVNIKTKKLEKLR